MATVIRSTKGLALKGILSRPARHEAFVTGSLQGDNMTLVYASQRSERISPRKVIKVNTTRFVTCERRYTPEADDYWWQAIGQLQLTHPAG